jgi:signal-transduction protein with cAMP-binding, CBS, and nucleotidyltransferase domain
MIKAIDVMTENIVSMDKSKGFKGALDIILKTKADYVIVTEKNIPLGIITERDLLRIISSKIKNISSFKLDNTITKDLVSVDLSTDIAEITSIMQEEDIRHLPVMEHDRILGIIKASDVFKKTKEIQQKNIKFSLYQNVQSYIIIAFFIFLLIFILYKLFTLY